MTVKLKKKDGEKESNKKEGNNNVRRKRLKKY